MKDVFSIKHTVLSNNMPVKILKETSDICSPIHQQI